jgi:hypothetical protein
MPPDVSRHKLRHREGSKIAPKHARAFILMRVREKRCGSNPCGGWGAGLLPPCFSPDPTSDAFAATETDSSLAKRGRPPAAKIADARRSTEEATL